MCDPRLGSHRYLAHGVVTVTTFPAGLSPSPEINVHVEGPATVSSVPGRAVRFGWGLPRGKQAAWAVVGSAGAGMRNSVLCSAQEQGGEA